MHPNYASSLCSQRYPVPPDICRIMSNCVQEIMLFRKGFQYCPNSHISRKDISNIQSPLDSLIGGGNNAMPGEVSLAHKCNGCSPYQIFF